MVRTWLDNDDISVEERGHLDCLLQILTGDLIPHAFVNSKNEDGESSQSGGSDGTEGTNEEGSQSMESHEATEV